MSTKLNYEIVFDDFVITNDIIISANKPKYGHHYVNNWLPITIQLNDLISKSPSQTIYHGLVRELQKGSNKNKTFKIRTLSSNKEEYQQWDIVIDKILYIDFGQLNEYSENSNGICTIVIQPKDCILNY
jgi:hypothetical protein